MTPREASMSRHPAGTAKVHMRRHGAPSCGQQSTNLTDVASEVTCAKCKTTVKYRQVAAGITVTSFKGGKS